MENVKNNKNTFLITCVSCIVLLLVMCYFGFNNSLKGTLAATEYTCDGIGGTLSNTICINTFSTSSNSCPSGWSNYPAGTSCSYGGSGLFSCKCYKAAKKIETDTTVVCKGGQYYNGNGSCSTCPAGSYCPGGTFNKSSTLVAGKFACQDGKTSPAGSSSCILDTDKPSNTGKCYQCNGNMNLYVWSAAGGTPSHSGCTSSSWTVVDKSETACVSSDTVSCDAGEYHYGYGQCKTCIAGYYCPGGEWKTTQISVGLTKCPDGTTSSAGAESEKNCSAVGSSSADCVCEKTAGGTSSYTCQTVINASQNGNYDNFKQMCTNYCNQHHFSGAYVSSSSCNINTEPDDEPGDNPGTTPSNPNGGSSGGTSGGGTGSGSGGTSGDNNTNDNNNNNNDNNNVNNNPQTGQIAIFMTWIIGIATIAYSIWYFRKLRKN